MSLKEIIDKLQQIQNSNGDKRVFINYLNTTEYVRDIYKSNEEDVILKFVGGCR